MSRVVWTCWRGGVESHLTVSSYWTLGQFVWQGRRLWWRIVYRVNNSILFWSFWKDATVVTLPYRSTSHKNCIPSPGNWLPSYDSLTCHVSVITRPYHYCNSNRKIIKLESGAASGLNDFKCFSVLGAVTLIQNTD